MLSTKELIELLAWNAVLLEEALESGAPDATRRLYELQVHRALLKDCLIDALMHLRDAA